MEPCTNNRVLQMNQRCNEMSNLGVMQRRSDSIVDVTRESMKSGSLSLFKMPTMTMKKSSLQNRTCWGFFSIQCWSCCTKWAEYLITGLMQMFFNVKNENDRVTIVESEIISCCSFADHVKIKSLPHVQHNDSIFSLGIGINNVQKSFIAKQLNSANNTT